MLRQMQYKPGVVLDDTSYAAMGWAVSSDKIRWVRGKPESLPGYEDASPGETMLGKARGMVGWVSNTGLPYVAIGTHRKLYVSQDGALFDVTPIRDTETLAANPLSTVSGSRTVTVTHAAHGCRNGDWVYVGADSAVGGIRLGGGSGSLGSDPYTVTEGSPVVVVYHASHGLKSGDMAFLSGGSSVGGLTVSGLYTVHVIDSDTYTIQDDTPATSSVSGGGTPSYSYSVGYEVTVVDADSYSVEAGSEATSTATGGGATVAVAYEISVGLDDGFGPSGYGQGGYGLGQYGLNPDPSGKADFRPRTWALDTWGEELVANPLGGTIYRWQLNLSKRAEAITNAPAKVDWIIVTAERFLMAFGCTATDGVYDPLMIRWSDFQDYETWFPTDTNLAGDYRLSVGSTIVSARVTKSGLLVWTDDGLYLGTYTGSVESVYGFEIAGRGCGLIGPLAAVERNGTAFWWTSGAGVYTYAGGVPKPVPCPVRRTVEEAIAKDQEYKMHAVFDSAYNGVTWHYPTSDTNEVSRYARLDINEQVDANSGWSVGTSDMTSWIDRGSLPKPQSARVDGMLCVQESGRSAAGEAVSRHVEWAPVEISGDGVYGQNVLNVRRCVFDADITGVAGLVIRTRRWPNGPEQVKGPYTLRQDTTKVDLRQQGRQAGFRIESDGTDDYWRIGNVRFDISQGPQR